VSAAGQVIQQGKKMCLRKDSFTSSTQTAKTIPESLPHLFYFPVTAASLAPAVFKPVLTIPSGFPWNGPIIFSFLNPGSALPFSVQVTD